MARTYHHLSCAAVASTRRSPDDLRMKRRPRERLVRDYYAAVDAGDLERALAPFSDDCLYERQGHGSIAGLDAIKAFYRHERIIKEGRHCFDQILCRDDWVAVRGEFVGSLRTGEAVELAFTDWFCIREYRIVYRQSLFPGRAV